MGLCASSVHTTSFVWHAPQLIPPTLHDLSKAQLNVNSVRTKRPSISQTFPTIHSHKCSCVSLSLLSHSLPLLPAILPTVLSPYLAPSSAPSPRGGALQCTPGPLPSLQHRQGGTLKDRLDGVPLLYSGPVGLTDLEVRNTSWPPLQPYLSLPFLPAFCIFWYKIH